MPNPAGQGTKKKKKPKGRTPKYQNTFAFVHNPMSKKTDKILSSPNVGVCRRCHDKIEWRKTYRKYKPRTQPGKCNLCSRKNVTAAYHTICGSCAKSEGAVRAMDAKGPKAVAEAGAVPASREKDTSTEIVSAGGRDVENTPEGERSVEEEAKLEADCDKGDADGETANGEENLKTAAGGIVGHRGSAPTSRVPSGRRIHVCAICVSEPVLSKGSDDDGGGEEAQRLEEMLREGSNGQGGKLTLREKKGAERKLENLRAKVKKEERRKHREALGISDAVEDENADDDEEEKGNNESSASNDDGDEDEEDNEKRSEKLNETDEKVIHDEAVDPFLQAVGGKDKLLVGEAYQEMLLAKEEQSCD